MGGTNYKNSIFVDYPKNYTDFPDENELFGRIWNENNWSIYCKTYRSTFTVKVNRLFRHQHKYEFLYQLRVINKYHLKKERIRRGVATVSNFSWEISTPYKPDDVWFEPPYNQYNFQVVAYAIIEKNGLRKFNFEDVDVYGRSTTVSTSWGNLEVPLQTINLRVPLLAKHIDEKRSLPALYSGSEEFFQVFHGVHVQLKVEEIKTLLKFAAKFQVFNVKKYCEQQLIWRDDLKVSEKRKFKMACKFNLNILMNQVLMNVKSVEELANLASIAIEMKSMDTNISKLLIAKMYGIS